MAHGARTGMSEAWMHEAARPTIEVYHVRFAAARRPAVSWQNLGRMLGVNAEDLRRAFEEGLNRTAGAVLKPVPPPKPPPREVEDEAVDRWSKRPRRLADSTEPLRVKGGSVEHMALAAIGEGFGLVADLGHRMLRSTGAAAALLHMLQLKRLVSKSGRGQPALLTDAGRAELGRLQALIDSGAAKW